METVRDFFFFGSKITADVTAAMKLKYAWQKKAMTNLDRILKNRDIAKKIHLVKAMVFPVVM